jgi:hypothetical protein
MLLLVNKPINIMRNAEFMKFSTAIFGVLLSFSGIARCWFFSNEENNDTASKFFSNEQDDTAKAADSEESENGDNTANFLTGDSNPDTDNKAGLFGFSDDDENK